MSGTSDVSSAPLPPISDSNLTTVLESVADQLNPPPDRGEAVSVDMGTDDAVREEAQSQQQNAANPSLLGLVLPYLSKYYVFLLVLLIKILYSHRYAILIIVATSGCWYYAESLLTAQIRLRSHVRHKILVSKLLWVVLFVGMNIFCIYYWFDEDGILSRRLWFGTEGANADKLVELGTLFWVLIMNDFAVKYALIIIKSVITLIPKTVINYQRKGSVYSLLERVGILYRSLLAVIPWYYYLLGDPNSIYLSALLFIAYVVFKFIGLYEQLPSLRTALLKVFTLTPYGSKPTAAELEGAGDVCPVCHDNYSNPIILACKHIFCEDCVSVWFDREKSCPMCRAQIVCDDCKYRSGDGSPMLSIF